MRNTSSKCLMVALSFILVNCSDVEFTTQSGPGQEGIKLSDNVEDSTDIGNRIWDIINNNEGNESTSRTDGILHKKIQDCLPLESIPLEPRQSLSGLDDVLIVGNVGPFSRIQPINRLEILNSVGPLAIHFASVLTESKGQRGSASIRAREVLSWLDSTGPLNLSTSIIEKIENVTGPVCLGAQTIGTIDSLTGSLIIIGPSTGMLIQKISKTRGPLLLFNVKVDEIEDHVGPTILYNSSYRTISSVGPVAHKVN